MTSAPSRFFRTATYAAVCAAAAYLYYLMSHFEYTPRAGAPGPDAWPKGILILTMLVSAYEMIKNAFARKQLDETEGLLESIVKESEEEHPEATAEMLPRRYPHLLAGGVVVTVGYVYFVDKLGFFLATALYLVLFLLLGRYRRWRVIAAVSLAGSLVLMFIFMKVVYVSLPLGVGPFEHFSVALMKLMGIR